MGFFRNWKHVLESNVEQAEHEGRINIDPLLLDQYPDAVYVLDRDLNFVDSNEKLSLLFSGEEERFVDPDSWLPKLESERVHAFHQRALHGETVHYELKALNADKRRIHLSVTNTPLYTGRVITGLYGVVKDLTTQMELRERYNRMKVGRTLFERIPGLILIELDLESGEFYHSPQTGELLGLSKRQLGDMKREHFRNMIHEDYRPEFAAAIETLIHDADVQEYETQIKAFNPKQQKYLDLIVKVGMSKDRKSVTWAMFDVTNLVKVEEALTMEQSKVKQLCEIVDSVIFERYFETKQFKFLTPGFSHIFGYTEDQFNTHPDYWQRVVVPDDVPKVNQAREVTLSGKPTTFSYRIYAKGNVKWIEENREPIFSEDGIVIGFRTLVKDITQLKEQQQEIWRLASLDPITNMPNRESITGSVYQLTRKRDPFTLFSLSFNRIAEINNTFGYELGDEWRVATVNQLIRLLPQDALLGHLDADNVLIVLPRRMEDPEVLALGKELGTLSKHRFHIDAYDLFARISIGVSRYPEDGAQASELIKHACVAMNRADKKFGTQLELYSSQMDIESLKRYELLRDMRGALKNNEFYLMYQPKVNAWTGQIVGAEALMRWTHPTWGSISPAEFIPLAEESSLHLDLTNWLIEEVCRYITSLKHRVPISINVSAKYLYQERFERVFEDMLDRFHVPASYLEVEISETSLLDDAQQITQAFERLNNLGIPIAFDDFGKGYSSLAYLQAYSAQTIKIDRIFAHNVNQSRKAQGIIRSLLLIAEEFGMNVVVEGVEMMDDLLRLREFGCHVIQGFIFSRPLRESDFEQALETGTLIPIEEYVETIQPSNRLIHAGITITRLRNQAVAVGTSPIVIMKRGFKAVAFYGSIRLPVDSDINLVILLDDGQPSLPIQVTRLTELANGLYQYEATYEQTVELEKRLTALESDKPRGFTIQQAKDLIER
ncbi:MULTISPECIES: EAL domain-containing protein [unclassified Exiguobacterium]|uniref:sensor domain-containing protein n=1 Tax=unclassified Exiguobacterium TaxID=2644629 RepID=UPI00104017D8|nr:MULTISPECIES: EAL domain-containing protein [unclassified Exiguobacterium]TCI39187.1 EAL domain-containing protein [Exiguobacterium sp. SH4S7]TCI63023.1 EAL domain-containing protein [Exiguobacterium sp. SH0S2]